MTWLQNQVINNTGPKDSQEITDLGIEFTFRDAPDNAGDGTKYYLSNTTGNPYTKSTVTFTDIHLEQHYTIIRDARFLSRPKIENVLLPIPELHVYTIENKSFNSTADTVKFSLSDVAKVEGIQFLKIFVRPILTAYNTSTACQHMSGSKYIGFKYSQIGVTNINSIVVVPETFKNIT